MSPLQQCRYTRSAVAGSKKSQDSSGEACRRILDAALTLFAAHGFTATTTKAIAEEAGVPGGLIFYSRIVHLHRALMGECSMFSSRRIRRKKIGLLFLDSGNTTHVHAAEELALAGVVAKLEALVIERERLLRERTEARANELAALEATRRMDTFLGIVSHELRTPLTVIKGNLQLARWNAQRTSNRQNDNANEAEDGIDHLPELLAHAEQQVNRLTRLVNDLTEVSRLHVDTMEMRMEICDLGTIVHEMVEEQRALTPTRTIHLELDSSCPLLVYADADRLGQVVTNYLSNALKYSPDEQPVEVSIEGGEQDVRVLVHDRGPGLTPLQQGQIWERFHRVEEMKVQSGSSVGLGLGLYISRMIIEQHQGHVGVESAPGEGSTFWFTLPYPGIKEEEKSADERENMHEEK